MRLFYLLLSIFCSASFLLSMESPKTRSSQQQEEIDQALYNLFTNTALWFEHIDSSLAEGVRLIRAGAHIRGPVSLSLRRNEKTFFDVAVNQFVQNNNIFPLLLLLQEGVNINTPNQLGQTAFSIAITSDPSQATVHYEDLLYRKDLKMSLEQFYRLKERLLWPIGPLKLPKYGDILTTRSGLRNRSWLVDWFNEHGTAINQVNNEGKTALTIIAQRINASQDASQRFYWERLFRELVLRGASIDQTEDVLSAIARVYNGNPVIELLLKGNEFGAISVLVELLRINELKVKHLKDIFTISAARGNEDITRYLLRNTPDLILEFDIAQAFVYAAQAGHQVILTLLLPYLERMVKSYPSMFADALLGAAGHGHSEVVQFFLSAGSWPIYEEQAIEQPESMEEEARFSEEEEDEDEPPRKKRKLVHFTQSDEFFHYDPQKYISHALLYEALVIASTQGYSNVVRVLLRYLYRSPDELTGDERLNISRLLTKALELALLNRHSDAVAVILEYDDRLGYIVDLNSVVHILNAVIADPSLTQEDRKQYEELRQLLATRAYMGIQLASEERLAPSEQYFMTLPTEALAIVMTLLYQAPYAKGT